MKSAYNKSFSLILACHFLKLSFLFVITPVNYVNAQVNEFKPGEWRFESQRPELAPLHSVNSDLLYKNAPTLKLSGDGKEHADGRWFITTDLAPDTYYRFRVDYLASQVEEPSRSILARILWLDENEKLVGTAEYPQTLRNKTNDNWNSIEQVYKSPGQAHKAKFELVYRWDANGTVHFGDFSFKEVTELPPRLVKLATIHHRPRGTKSSLENLNQFADFIAQAGQKSADIVCLPEAATMVGTGQNYVSAAEPVPGPTTKFLGDLARKYELYIVAGILEREGDVVYNTAVLIDRKGALAGVYRKVSLPREEIEGGVTPGTTIPVFDTDFGRIGIMICWDVSFPEVARTLALQGAEVILMPIWGGNLTLTEARAIENQVFLVTSTYNMKSAIFDRTGQILEEATDDNPLVITEVDLNKVEMWPWLGDFRNRIPREIPARKALIW